MLIEVQTDQAGTERYVQIDPMQIAEIEFEDSRARLTMQNGTLYHCTEGEGRRLIDLIKKAESQLL